MRSLILTDIHADELSGKKRHSPRALYFTRRALRTGNFLGVNRVVNLGDCISRYSQLEDMRGLERVREVFSMASAPQVHIPGNNDLFHLSRTEFQRLMGGQAANSYVDMLGDTEGAEHVQFIYWMPDVRINGTLLPVPDADIQWLETALKVSQKPNVFIFSHLPLDMAPRDELERKDYQWSFYPNGQDIKDVLKRSCRRIVHTAGHMHYWRHIAEDGIDYITLPSPVQPSVEDPDVPVGAYTHLTIEGDVAKIDVRGKEPQKLTLPLVVPVYC